MPRIRTVKPEFWEDEGVGILSREARLLFIATWNLADDEGLLRWSPAYLKASVFMYDDDIQVDSVELLMKELEASGVVYVYREGKSNTPFGYVVNFHKHQKINRPSPPKFNSPTPYTKRAQLMYAERDGWVCHICGEPVDPEAEDVKLRPSLDHVQPKSKGGGNYPSNIALAHRGCNSSKQDSVIEPVTEDSLSESWSDSVPEGKGREREEEGRGRELAPKTARDGVWDAMSAIFGEPTTRTNRSLRGKLVKSLAGAGATRDEIVDRVQAWPHHFPDATLTETALEKHWDRLARPPAKASRADVERFDNDRRLAEGEQRARRLDRGLPA